MIEVAVCSAPADHHVAQALIQYLQLNLTCRVEPAPLPDWLDFPGLIESTSGGEAVIAVLSPNSVPRRFPRERWDSIVDDPNLAWMLAADCPYPAMLNKRVFADARKSEFDAFAALRRWLLTRELSVPAARPSWFDSPGAGKVSDWREFEDAAPYFELAFTLDARHRTPTSLLAELAGALALDRSADSETLAAEVQQSLRARRALIGVDGSAPELDTAPGRASIVTFAGRRKPVVPPPAHMLTVLLASMRGRGEAPSPADLDRSLASAFASAEWPLLRELALAAWAYFKSEYRLAEAYDLLARLRAHAQKHGDVDVMNDCIVGQSWIGERWSTMVSAADPPAGPQLAFQW